MKTTLGIWGGVLGLWCNPTHIHHVDAEQIQIVLLWYTRTAFSLLKTYAFVFNVSSHERLPPPTHQILIPNISNYFINFCGLISR